MAQSILRLETVAGILADMPMRGAVCIDARRSFVLPHTERTLLKSGMHPSLEKCGSNRKKYGKTWVKYAPMVCLPPSTRCVASGMLC